ncbi:glycoside hydrolase family 43 protein [Pelomonas sp. Root1444]|uniref:glycoside hydrolase family 43 protein n=1 Tax=Pelomonas sp. Root1444 TaxID=1736464 RepID=UPI0009EB83BF|nr:glycoside hydrolase family 43 protein [Pelomonas sp. Root1444]
MRLARLLQQTAFCCTAIACAAALAGEPAPGANPVLRDRFTADPAPLVVGDTVYLHVGRDEAKGNDFFLMKEWLAYSSKDLRHWTAHGTFMKPTDFKWAVSDAWAGQVVQRNGRFYFYATVQHDNTQYGKAIGVAVADSPLGPFKDARGSALITDASTPSPYGWSDIDPTVFIDDDGTAWLAWGNPVLYLAKLKASMTELDGPIEKIALPNYTEGPWLSKRKGTYYMTYASMAHQGLFEHLSYATAPSPRGPWTYQGLLTGAVPNSFTIHAGVIDDFKGQSYLVYHNAALTLNGEAGATSRRSVAMEYLHYDADGRMWPVTQTEAGISKPPQPPAGKVPALPDPGRSDPRVAVQQFAQGYPESWPGTPALASVTRPFEQTPEPIGFNRDGGSTRLTQSFVPRADIPLGRLSLYAGDGHGTDATRSLRLSLRDVEAGTELLGAGEGLAIAYRPQGAGLLSFDFSAHPSVVLKAGRRYALALQGQKDALTINLRASRSDVYADGEATLDDRPLKDKESGRPADFAFALYARQAR